MVMTLVTAHRKQFLFIHNKRNVEKNELMWEKCDWNLIAPILNFFSIMERCQFDYLMWR